jgi:hypothetical protein
MSARTRIATSIEQMSERAGRFYATSVDVWMRDHGPREGESADERATRWRGNDEAYDAMQVLLIMGVRAKNTGGIPRALRASMESTYRRVSAVEAELTAAYFSRGA